jgi:hypothetical protein
VQAIFQPRVACPTDAIAEWDCSTGSGAPHRLQVNPTHMTLVVLSVVMMSSPVTPRQRK